MIATLKRSTVRTGLGVAAGLVGLLAAVVPAAPANASLALPDGGNCSVVPSWSQPTASTLKLTYTARCSVLVEEFYMGLTVQGGGAVNTGGGSCVKVYNCTQSVTIKDPAGSQHFEGHNETRVRRYPTTRKPVSALYNTGTTT